MNMNQIYFTSDLHFLTLEDIYNAAIEKIKDHECRLHLLRRIRKQ